LPTTRHRCNLDVWALTQCRGDGHRSLVIPEMVLGEYNEDLIWKLFAWKFIKKQKKFHLDMTSMTKSKSF